MPNLIKGYLPVQISLPSVVGKSSSAETFIFVKEHVLSRVSSTEVAPTGRTLFVANTPLYPNIRTSLLLTCLFEKFGQVEKVVVVPHPSKIAAVSEGGGDVDSMILSTFEKEIRSLGHGTKFGMGLDEDVWYDQGRFAHVTFSSNKEMKKVFAILSGGKKKNKGKEGDKMHVSFGKLELQELQDTSFDLYRNEKKSYDRYTHEEDEGDKSEENDDSTEEERMIPETGITAIAKCYRDSIPSRKSLKELCNKIMMKYEEKEEEAHRKKKEAMAEPDEDGFVTVSHATVVGDAVGLERNGTLESTGAGAGRRRKEAALKRSRSTRKNVVKGSAELPDFYRFQLKESKKRGREVLKSRFQEDLKRVKEMKEQKKFRPF
jgi:ribosomal RNA-processing protein 7